MIVFDLDGTLLEAASSWGTLNRFFGNDNRALLEQYLRGGIDYLEFMRRDIAAWPKPLHISRVREALAGWTLRPDAPESVAALRAAGFELAILSGGVHVLAEEVAERLGIPEPWANELVTDEAGFLTGEARLRVDPLRKERALARLCEQRGVAPEACVTVGDSELDRSFLQAGGLGVLVGDEALAAALGAVAVPGLAALPELVTSGPPTAGA
jgi:phosphoserine phosphatase